jgi:hypothetical protein
LANSTTHVIRGTLHWAKVLGRPRLNTYTEENEWSVDVTPDAAGVAELERIGVLDKMKAPKKGDTRKEKFISFRQREMREDRKTGERIANQPIKVVDVRGQAWPDNKLIGNGSVADVKFTVKDNGKGKPKGVYIQAIRVLELVEYEMQDFAPLSEDDEFFAGENAKNSEETKSKAFEADLDDDVPF